MGKECPSCGNEYKSLGSHLAHSSCEYPEFTDRQKEILKGMMLGDGWVNHQTKVESANPFFAVGMTNYEFLEWLDGEMRPHSTGVKDATGSKDSTKPYYKIRTMRTPKLDGFAEWYETGELKLKQIDLTPLSMKMWYVSDGSYNHKKRAISIGNRIAENRDVYFGRLFSGMSVDPWVGEDNLHFNQEDTQELFNYMGESVRGFEYKWPNENVECITPLERAKNDENQDTLV